MTIETLEKRLQNAQLKLEKEEKKYERILKAAKSNYTQDNPYYYDEYDKKNCENNIYHLKAEILNYNRELQIAREKANSRDIPIIIEFLKNWKEKVYNYYNKDLSKYYIEKEILRQAFLQYDENRYTPGADKFKKEYEEARKILHCKLNGYKERKTFVNRWGKEDYTDVKVKDGEWEHIKHYIERSNSLEEALKLLDKELEQEKNRKYDFIIERTNKIVGQITNAQGLRISGDGELNGLIYGTRGKASVETIGCAGYNIQCYHFRCYIKETL